MWVAFDRDDHPCWSTALDQARANGFKLATSNPCIELWALLLHQDQTAHLHRHSAQSQLKRLHPGYDHHKAPCLNLTVVLEAMTDAAARAAHLRRLAHELGEPDRNPCTRFDQLVARIMELADSGSA